MKEIISGLLVAIGVASITFVLTLGVGFGFRSAVYVLDLIF